MDETMANTDNLKELDGKCIGNVHLVLANVEEGRYQEEKNFELLAEHDGSRTESPLVAGKYYRGRQHYSPWLEISHYPELKFDDGTEHNLRESGEHQKLFDVLSGLLPPGSHMMVAYTQHRETRRALEVQVPPPATPIGRCLWVSGFTWFKDWYIAEGFTEGDVKLQGNKPTSKKRKEKHIKEVRENLENYLDNETSDAEVHQNARKRAKDILQNL